MNNKLLSRIEIWYRSAKLPRFFFAGLYGLILLTGGGITITILHFSNERIVRYLPFDATTGNVITSSTLVPDHLAISAALLLGLTIALLFDINRQDPQLSNRRIRTLEAFLLALSSLLVALLISQVAAFVAFQPGEQVSQPTYGLELTVSGPSRIRANEQVAFTLNATMFETENYAPIIQLDGKQPYEISARLQPGAFNVSQDVTGLRERQRLTSTSSAQWIWIVVPQLERLGTQTMVFEVLVFDQANHLVTGPEAVIVTVEVVNPLGIPEWIVYGTTSIGSLLSVPIWVWVYQEASLRLKEKREQAQTQYGKQKKIKRPK